MSILHEEVVAASQRRCLDGGSIPVWVHWKKDAKRKFRSTNAVSACARTGTRSVCVTRR